MWKTYQTLVPYLKKRLPMYALGVLLLLITNTGQLFIPQFLKTAIDNLSKGQTQTMGWLILGLIATALVVAISRLGWRYFIIGAARRIEAALRFDIFQHLLKLSPSFYAKQKTGDLMARITNDMDAVRISIGMAMVALVDAVFLTISILCILFIQNPGLGLVTILPLPIITLLMLTLGRMVGKLFRGVQEQFSRLSSDVQEALQGVRVIKAFVQEENFVKKFIKTNDDFKSANMKLVRLWGFFFPIIGMLSGLSTLILLVVGGQAVIQKNLTPGEFTAYISYLGMLIWPIMGVGMVVNFVARGTASLGRINEILHTPAEISSPKENAHPEPRKFDLEIKNLSFTYPQATEPALKNISFSIPQGSFVGVLGSIGSGKTTLTKALLRLWEVPPDTIFLDGIDIRQYELASLRKCFSMVPQTPFLFSDTIKNNICFANPSISDEKLQELLELSTINRDLETFELGVDTLVGERGVTLSGGQKQRITLSRALASEAPILVLDDALASVDLETEGRIIDHLVNMDRTKTCLLISHRISALRHCDQIIVLDQGQLVQKGTHDQLVNEEGIYSEIFRLQTLRQGGSHDPR